MSRDPATIADIVGACRNVMKFTRDMTQEQFNSDDQKQSAVLYQITIMGEATRRLSKEFRVKHPEIPWAAIAAMRNRLIHQYDEVDLQLVWDDVTSNIPSLLRALEPLMPPPAQE